MNASVMALASASEAATLVLWFHPATRRKPARTRVTAWPVRFARGFGFNKIIPY